MHFLVIQGVHRLISINSFQHHQKVYMRKFKNEFDVVEKKMTYVEHISLLDIAHKAIDKFFS